MDEEQRKRLEAKSRIGKTVWFKDKQTGKIIYEYPDEPDGSASVRYGQEHNIRNKSLKFA